MVQPHPHDRRLRQADCPDRGTGKAEGTFQQDFRTLEEGTYEGEAYILKITDSTRETPDAAYAKEIKAATEAFKASKSPQYLRAHVTQKPIRTHTATHRAPTEEVEEDEQKEAPSGALFLFLPILFVYRLLEVCSHGDGSRVSPNVWLGSIIGWF